MPKISVIMPTYNSAKYLPEAINSILNQSYQDFEIIIVDDGSVDNTSFVVGEYKKKYDKKIVYIYQDNKGPGEARNAGIKVATGEYITFLDSDDIVLSDSLILRMKVLDQNPSVDLIFSDYKIDTLEKPGLIGTLESKKFNRYLRKVTVYQDSNVFILNKKFYKVFIKFTPHPISTIAVMIRRLAVNKFGVFRGNFLIGEDVEYWSRFIEKGNVAYISVPLANYRHNLSIVTKDTKIYYINTINLYKELLLRNKNFVIALILRNRLANSYYELAFFHKKNKFYVLAFNNLFLSMLYNPWSYKTYKTFLATCLNRFILFIKQSLKKIIYNLTDLVLCLKKRKYILFIVHNEVMFSYVRPMYENLKKDKRLRLLFCFETPNHFLPGKLKAIKKDRYIHNMPYWLAKFVKWDLILFPDHGSHFRSNSKKIYTGHGVEISKIFDKAHYVWGDRSRDRNNKIIYDKFFTSSEQAKDNVKKFYPEFYPRVKVVGNMLAEEMLNFVPHKDEILHEHGLDPAKKTIMFTSSWGPYALLRTNGSHLLSKMPQLLKSYNVIVTVHINNFVDKNSGGINWRDLLSKQKYANLYIILDGGEPYKLLSCADLLVTDMSSLSAYFTLLARPVIFIDNKDFIYGPDSWITYLKKGAYVVNNLDDIEIDITKALNSFEAVKMREISQIAFSYIGSSWQRYADEIYETLLLKHSNN